MGDSLYMYCYTNENTTMGDRHPCPLGWMVKGGVPPGAFGGIVGFDHYFTSQGMPCKDGRPQEFELQDAAALWAKTAFPRARVLQYRITSAVPVSANVSCVMHVVSTDESLSARAVRRGCARQDALESRFLRSLDAQ
jgi:hypothetical protein